MQPYSRAEELNEFKTKINFCQFLSERGFQLDRRNSSRCSAVMKHPNGDKLIISRSPTMAWIYFNVHGNDSGTIIDFVQRDGLSLGEVRKQLRPWLGRPEICNDQLKSDKIDLKPSQSDVAKVVAAWSRAAIVERDNRYLKSRSLPSEVFCHVRFSDRIRVDARYNVLFAHWTDEGLSGYEVKNKGRDGRTFTGFAPGGTKGLFFSDPTPNDNELVCCETAIDLLSYAAHFGMEGRRLISVGGQVSALQLQLIASAANKMPPGSTVTLAMDNDKAGRELADRIKSHLVTSGAFAGRIQIHLPPLLGEDWNDALSQNGKVQPRSPSPMC